MGISGLYYTLMSGQTQCRYGEIKTISCWDSEIPLRSDSVPRTPMNRRSLRPIGELNVPNFVLNHVVIVPIGLVRNLPLRSFGSSASRIWERMRD